MKISMSIQRAAVILVTAALLGLTAACGETKEAANNNVSEETAAEVTAREPGTEVTTQASVTETVTEALTTEPVTEAATEAPTKEPATEAPTEEPATEAPTEEPATEAPTEEPVTEAPTEEPVTEAPTEEPATEAPTQEPATKAPTSSKLQAPYGIAFLGDSITVGYYSAYSYADVVCEDLGLVQFNYGHSGWTLAASDGGGLVEAYDSINPGVKVIVVYGGSNDYYNNVPLDTPSSTKSDSFYGALNKLCAGLKKSYPDAHIVFMTPLPGQFQGKYNSGNNETGDSMWDYVDAMQKTCYSYNIPVIDMYHNFDITADNFDSYTVDGLHPNENGHQLIAKALEKYLSTLMQ